MIFLMLVAIALGTASPAGITDPLAVYAFYFLVIGMGIQLLSYIKHTREHGEAEEEIEKGLRNKEE
jgi:hypothetical protein